MHIVMLLTGGVSCLAGAILLPLPIPLGLPLMVVGAALILSASPAARRWFRRWRGTHRDISDKLLDIEPAMPEAFRKTLDETHPDAQDGIDTRR